MITPNKRLGSIFGSWVSAKKAIKQYIKHFPAGLRRNLARVEKRAIQYILPGKRPAMSDADRAYLEDLFAEQNTKLSEFMGRELAHWQ